MKIYYVAGIPYSDELYHYGVPGMEWGKRRYQNRNGSLTSLGKLHYGVGDFGNEVGKKVNNNAMLSKYQNSDGSLTSLGKKRYLAGQTEHYSSPKEAIKQKGESWVPKNKTVKDWWTGDNYKQSSNMHRDFSKDYREESLLARGLAYNDHYSGGASGIPNQAWESQAQDYADKSAEEEEIANQLDTLYENSPRQVVKKTIKKGKEAVKNIVEGGKKTVSDIGSWASSQIDKGKKFFKGLFH